MIRRGCQKTGGISHDNYVVEYLTDMLSFIAPVKVMAGEFEMVALAAGTVRVLEGAEDAKTYTGIPVWQGFQTQKDFLRNPLRFSQLFQSIPYDVLRLTVPVNFHSVLRFR